MKCLYIYIYMYRYICACMYVIIFVLSAAAALSAGLMGSSWGPHGVLMGRSSWGPHKTLVIGLRQDSDMGPHGNPHRADGAPMLHGPPHPVAIVALRPPT